MEPVNLSNKAVLKIIFAILAAVFIIWFVVNMNHAREKANKDHAEMHSRCLKIAAGGTDFGWPYKPEERKEFCHTFGVELP